MASSSFLSSFFVTLLILFQISPSRSEWSRISNFRADKLINELNLFPKTDINIVHGNATDSFENSGSAKKIVERKFRFPDISDSGVSVEDLGHHAGYYKIKNSHSARMFYFFFESRGNNTDPVVIWLTGGPGCSSEMALFYENGPFTISNDLSLVWNEYGWDKTSNLLYIDQPIGTGFSYTYDRRDIRDNEGDISDDLYDFLQAFFLEHPQFAKNDFFITGESYAGHYIPALAARVHRGNKAKEGVHINLKGFAMGNGLTDPATQYRAYADYAWNMGIISEYVYYSIDSMLPYCEREIKRCGNSRWVHSMKWSGQKKFGSSNFTSFSVDGSKAGSLKSNGPVSLLKVYDAGHMVPMDQPKAALEMLKRWTQGKLS